MHDQLMHCCRRTWSIVKDVLCVDSPEGQHEDPEDLDDEAPLDIGLKDTLSYCWRSLKESRYYRANDSSHTASDQSVL